MHIQPGHIILLLLLIGAIRYAILKTTTPGTTRELIDDASEYKAKKAMADDMNSNDNLRDIQVDEKESGYDVHAKKGGTEITWSLIKWLTGK